MNSITFSCPHQSVDECRKFVQEERDNLKSQDIWCVLSDQQNNDPKMACAAIRSRSFNVHLRFEGVSKDLSSRNIVLVLLDKNTPAMEIVEQLANMIHINSTELKLKFGPTRTLKDYEELPANYNLRGDGTENLTLMKIHKRS